MPGWQRSHCRCRCPCHRRFYVSRARPVRHRSAALCNSNLAFDGDGERPYCYEEGLLYIYIYIFLSAALHKLSGLDAGVLPIYRASLPSSSPSSATARTSSRWGSRSLAIGGWLARSARRRHDRSGHWHCLGPSCPLMPTTPYSSTVLT
eukprot:SAG31_NODE_474_length_15176_cov_7.362340_8_plen_149_part_00